MLRHMRTTAIHFADIVANAHILYDAAAVARVFRPSKPTACIGAKYRGENALSVWLIALIGVAHTHFSHMAASFLITAYNQFCMRPEPRRKLAHDVGLPVRILDAHAASDAAGLHVSANAVHCVRCTHRGWWTNNVRFGVGEGIVKAHPLAT